MKPNVLRGALAVAVAAAALATPARAPAQVVEQQATPAKPQNWVATAGVRTTLVRSEGLDPFASNDALHQFSASIQRVLVRSGAFAFSAGAVTEIGMTSAEARSSPAELQAWRLAAVAEARYQPWHRGYGFVRFAPGVLGLSAQLRDASTPNGATLTDSFQVLSADVSAGAAARLSPPGSPVAFWAAADAGYSWAGSHHLLLSPGGSPRDQAKLAPLDLGTIEPRGAFGRISLVLTY
jgi:hypothetical protein